MIRVEWAGEHFDLYAEKALLWEEKRTLIIADSHFGKAATLRTAGIPVPSGTSSHDLQRLSHLLDRSGARRLLILGDFFHAAAGRVAPTMRVLADWREQRRDLEVVLIRGNHDRHAGAPPAEWDFQCVGDEWRESDILFCHHACHASAPFVMAGHLHPAVLLEDDDGTCTRLPCFCLGAARALLPAFGSFTGAKRIAPEPGDRVFVTTGRELAEVTLR